MEELLKKGNTFFLQSITNSKNNSKRSFNGKIKFDPRNCLVFHCYCLFQGQENPTYYQMRIARITASTVALRCIFDCTARLTLELGNVKVQHKLNAFGEENGQFVWADDMTKDYLKNTENYGELKHLCTARYCSTSCVAEHTHKSKKKCTRKTCRYQRYYGKFS